MQAACLAGQRTFHRDGRPIKDFRRVWAQACAAAGISGQLVHDLRRSAVRNLERAGVPRSVAMKLTGHKTESVYRRWAIVSEADLSEGWPSSRRSTRDGARASDHVPSAEERAKHTSKATGSDTERRRAEAL